MEEEYIKEQEWYEENKDRLRARWKLVKYILVAAFVTIAFFCGRGTM